MRKKLISFFIYTTLMFYGIAILTACSAICTQVSEKYQIRQEVENILKTPSLNPEFK